MDTSPSSTGIYCEFFFNAIPIKVPTPSRGRGGGDWYCVSSQNAITCNQFWRNSSVPASIEVLNTAGCNKRSRYSYLEIRIPMRMWSYSGGRSGYGESQISIRIRNFIPGSEELCEQVSVMFDILSPNIDKYISLLPLFSPRIVYKLFSWYVDRLLSNILNILGEHFSVWSQGYLCLPWGFREAAPGSRVLHLPGSQLLHPQILRK